MGRGAVPWHSAARGDQYVQTRSINLFLLFIALLVDHYLLLNL